MTSGSVVVTFSGYTVFCSAPDGSVVAPQHGLFHRDTRILSNYRLTVGDVVPELVAQSKPESDRWDAVLRVPRPGGHADGPLLPQDALEVAIRRRVGPGMLDRIEVRNHSAVPCDTTVRVDLDADFADVSEIDGKREQQGRVVRTAEHDALELDYIVERDGRRVERAVRVDVIDASSEPQTSESGFQFAIHLEPRGTWHASTRVGVRENGGWRAPESVDDGMRAHQRAVWRDRRPAIECSGFLEAAFERATDDLFDLRNWELEERFLGTMAGRAWILNAGVPTFTGLFGRDLVTSGWQSALVGPRAALGAVHAVAAVPAQTNDPWRDAEPGKLIHELRSGPVSELGIDPRDAYYGSQTTPAIFVLALSELWHWTGDTNLLRRYRDVALNALKWAETYGDADRDGFMEYERRSPRGLRNQGWKDSDEAIRYPNGAIVAGPVATVEEQAFHFLALGRMAEILIALNEDALADTFLERANELRRRWHAAYWMPEDNYYALALDGAKQQVRSIASNPGHALGAGIVPPQHARAVADRLLAPELFSGWGVRSLSNRHPSYNPFAYHLGAVWPVEQATFALGFKRYGLDDHVERLVDAVFAAAAQSGDHRLPEALSGHDRDSGRPPIPYPGANSPQAWSASALIQLVQIMLGLYPFAPLHVLAVVRPRLPSWLPELTLRHVRVANATVDLRFKRRSDGSASWSVVAQRGKLLVIPGGPPDDVDSGSPWERLEYGALRRMPGRLVRAGRVALGFVK